MRVILQGDCTHESHREKYSKGDKFCSDCGMVLDYIENIDEFYIEKDDKEKAYHVLRLYKDRKPVRLASFNYGYICPTLLLREQDAHDLAMKLWEILEDCNYSSGVHDRWDNRDGNGEVGKFKNIRFFL